MTKFFFCVIATLFSANSALSAAEIRITDDLGNQITLQKPASRIVSLSPHNTENLFTAGAGELVVGAVDFSDFPEAAKHIPRVGGAQQINLEAIVRAQPDLIVAWASGNPPQALARLQDMGYPVYHSEPRSFAEVIDNLRDLALLSGQNPNASHITQAEQGFARIVAEHQGKPRVSVFYQIWDQPLMSLSGEHMVGKLIEHCGGENIFAAAPALSPVVNREAVIAANPAVILLASSAADQQKWQKGWEKWSSIDAVQKKRIHPINPDWVSRQTVRLLSGFGLICDALNSARSR